jgi:hypothetical protein
MTLMMIITQALHLSQGYNGTLHAHAFRSVLGSWPVIVHSLQKGPAVTETERADKQGSASGIFELTAPSACESHAQPAAPTLNQHIA